jgi:hypothetical protein
VNLLRVPTLLAAWLFTGGVARAQAPEAPARAPSGQGSVRYAVRVGETLAGTRDVSWSWMPERQIVSQYTRATVLGKPLEVRCTGSFSRRGSATTCASAHGDDRWEVQARGRTGSGWTVDAVDGTRTPPREVGLTCSTLDLFDASRAPALLAEGPFALLVAETGEVLSGVAEAPAPVDVRVGNATVPATRHRLRGTGGALIVDLNAEGALLALTLQTPLLDLALTATALPPARSWESLEGLDLEPGVRELK